MLTTTFKLLRKHDACKDRYKVLRKSLKGRKDNDPITLIEILDSNGLSDTLWALCAVPAEQAAERDKLARLYACAVVRQVWHLLTDGRSRAAVDVAERYAVGDATQDELNAAAADADAVAAAAAANAYANAYAYAAAYAEATAYATNAAAAAAAADAYAYAAAAEYAAYAVAAYASYAAARAAQAAMFREMFGGVTC